MLAFGAGDSGSNPLGAIQQHRLAPRAIIRDPCPARKVTAPEGTACLYLSKNFRDEIRVGTFVECATAQIVGRPDLV
jgi:hypothetical protein